MAQRDLTTFRQVTQQVVEQPDQLLQAAAGIAEKVIRQGEEAKLAEGFSVAQLDLSALDSQYKIDFQGDPTNKDGVAKYKADRQAIYDNLGKNMSPLYRRQWQDGTRKLTERNDVVMQAWGLKQTQVNTIASVNNIMKNGLSQAASDGAAVGNGTMSIEDALVNYVNTRENITAYAENNLGEVTGGETVKSYDEDHMKTLISGISETDPVEASRILDNDAVKDSFDGPAQWRKMKKDVDNRVLNVGKIRVEKEVLSAMTSENSLFAQSSERQIPYAELQQAYARDGTSKAAQSVINKMNGYAPSGGSQLTAEEKVIFNNDLFDDIASLEGAEGVTPADIKGLQDRVYEGLNNKSITSAAGRSALRQLLEPSVNSMSEAMETFSRDTWVPFDEIGFKKVRKTFDSKFKIDEEDSSLSKRQLNKVNNLNKQRLYQSYNDALIDLMPDGVPIADISTLSSRQRNKILKDAQTTALNDYATKSFGFQPKDTDTEQDVLNAIQSNQEAEQRSAGQDVIDKAYQTPPTANFKIMVDASGNRARVFDDGRIEEIE